MNRYSATTSVVLGLATAAALLPLRLLSRDQGLLPQALLLVVILAALGGVLRSLRIPPAWAHVGQAVLLAATMLTLGLRVQDPFGGHPGLLAVARTGIQQMQAQAPPVAATPEARWVFLLFAGLVLIVTDLLVTTLAAPAWSIAPLATIYLVPSIALAGRVPWWQFALLGAGYLAVLATDTVAAQSTWTRTIAADTAVAGGRRRPHSGAVWQMAVLVGVPVLALAVGIGLLAPFVGRATGLSGDRHTTVVQMHDPTINLAHDLNQPANSPVLTYTTSNGKGMYLRLAALTVLTPSGWGFPTSGVVLRPGRLPAAPGAHAEGEAVSGRVRVGNFASQYLPLPYAPTAFTIEGRSGGSPTGDGAAAADWRTNPSTLEVVSTGSSGETATRGLSYSFTSEVDQPDPARFSHASAGVPDQDAGAVTQVPASVPQEIVDLAHQITRGATSDAQKAQKLQDWLADPQRFHYDRSAPGGSGFDVLTNFLTVDHSGYCIHFASSMALMARIVGIPSRVASGFLPGHRVGDHWEVDTHDLHAWPELYFRDYGWVRFEPTVAITTAPPWTPHNGLRPTAEPSTGASTGAGASARPTASASTLPTPARPTMPASVPPLPPAPPAPSPGGLSARDAGLVAGVLLVLLALAAPMLGRRTLRRRRLGAHTDPHAAIDDAWHELRATRTDLGHDWPPGSPRAVAERLAAGLDAGTAASLRHLASWVERSRYAAGLDAEPDELDADVRGVRDTWLAGATRGQRLRALLLPRSLWHERWHERRH